MRVLTVYAHNNPHSFCHALLCRFTEGLVDAGHTSDVVLIVLALGGLAGAYGFLSDPSGSGMGMSGLLG